MVPCSSLTATRCSKAPSARSAGTTTTSPPLAPGQPTEHGHVHAHQQRPLADVQRGIRWVRAHAGDYDLDPSRLAVMGFSAGGHLASKAATLFDEKAYEATDAIDEVSARPDLSLIHI